MASVSGRMVSVDEDQVRGHVDEVVRTSVEETLNGLLDAEADQLCQAKRYERTADRPCRYASRKLRSQATDESRRGHLKGASFAFVAV